MDNNQPAPKYVVVIPAKDEEINISGVLQSLSKQSVRPEICVVVDDNSIDGTPAIVAQFAADHGNIRCIHKSGGSSYSLGGHVVEVFEYGKNYIDKLQIDYEYIVKLDSDITFSHDFMEQLFANMQNRNLAIASGTPILIVDGERTFDFSPDWHSQGQFKIYNHSFLDQKNKIPKSLGWDTADNIIAICEGWETTSFKNIFYEMSRSVGGKQSLSKGRTKHGIGCYVLGYNPLYFILVVIHDLVKPPLLIGSVSLVKGYFSAMISRRKKILNKQQQKVLRQLLWRSLFSRLKKQEFVVFQKINKSKY